MWKYFGTFVNVITVIIGSLIGLMMRSRKPKEGSEKRERLSDIMMPCLGLCSIFAAASGLLGIESGVQAIIVVFSMVSGLLIGYALRLDDRINALCDGVARRAGSSGENPAAGFIMASLLFCIGSMTILGAFEGAMNPPGRLDLNCHTTLLIKSLLDFVSATCLAAIYGPSVIASALFVLVFQGLLTLLTSAVQPFLLAVNALPMVYCTGSLVIIVIAMNLLGLKKMKTADYIPAMFMPILVCWILSLFGITV